MNTNSTPNPDHHIWNNNGTWWCHFTVHHPDHTKERVRVSLHTKDREEARVRRDFIMRGTASIVSTIPRTRALSMPGPVPGLTGRHTPETREERNGAAVAVI